MGGWLIEAATCTAKIRFRGSTGDQTRKVTSKRGEYNISEEASEG